MSNNPAGPVSGGAYQSAADVRRLAEEGELDLNGKLTVSQGTKIFNRGINLLRAEEERLMKAQKAREVQEKAIAGDRYRPKQLNISQTLAEQRHTSPPGVAIKKASTGSSSALDSRAGFAANQDGLASKVRMKRNAGVGAQNSSEILPERNMSLGTLPIIPEKGDPSLALYEPTKNSGIPVKAPSKQGKYASQYETQHTYASQPGAVLQDRAREIVRASPYSK